MKVFKFGGASVKSAAGVRNIASIIRSFSSEKLLVVISAMGKTTDALERLVALARTKKDYTPELEPLRQYHNTMAAELMADATAAQAHLAELFTELETALKHTGDDDMVYDQVVSFGEILSTSIIAHFLKEQGFNTQWIDARHYIATDATFREGKIDWKKTEKQVQPLKPILDH